MLNTRQVNKISWDLHDHGFDIDTITKDGKGDSMKIEGTFDGVYFLVACEEKDNLPVMDAKYNWHPANSVDAVLKIINQGI